MFLLMLSALLAADPAKTTVIPLWTDKVPGPELLDPKNPPNLTIYLPKEHANGTAVVVCPGGGYGALALGHEGSEIAEWLNQRGVAAFVLRYRVASTVDPKNSEAVKKLQNPSCTPPLDPAPMLDVQRALRLVRSRAEEFHINPKRIGVWGFSAGGHLASTAATHFDDGKSDSADPIDKTGCRPDFAILAYPVITMGGKTHGGSRNNLIGKTPDAKKVEYYSNELQVTSKTPPTFLFHTAQDTAVPIENSRLFKAACEKNNVPVELVEFEKGQHGIGLALKMNIPAAKWSEKLEEWLKKQGLLEMK